MVRRQAMPYAARFLIAVLIAAATTVVGSAERFPRPEVLDPNYKHDLWKTRPTDEVREFGAFTVSFDSGDDDNGDGEPDILGIPEWVSYEMHKGNESKTEFSGRWLVDPDLWLRRLCPNHDSYTNSGYSRGHMCMRAHASRISKDADWNTHTTLNACPQKQSFNNGIWKGLELKCSRWADAYGKIWVICGPVITDWTPSKWIGDEGDVEVAVPDKFFKIVVKDSRIPTRPDVLAFIYCHDETLSSSAQHISHVPFLKSVRVVEALTRLNFFSELSQSDQNAIESEPATELWPLDGPRDTEMLLDRELADVRELFQQAEEERLAGRDKDAVKERQRRKDTEEPDGVPQEPARCPSELSLWLDFIGKLMWPLITLVFLIAFYRPLRARIAHVTELALPGLTLKLERALERAKVHSGAPADIPSPPERPEVAQFLALTNAVTKPAHVAAERGIVPSPTGLDIRQYEELVPTNPAAALVLLRYDLELIERNVASAFGVPLSPNMSAKEILGALYSHDAITDEQRDLAIALLDACDAAVHGVAVSREQAESILKIAQRIFDAYNDWLRRLE